MATSTTSKPPIRVLIVDDHDMVRKGIRSWLEAEADIDVVAEGRSGADVRPLVGMTGCERFNGPSGMECSKLRTAVYFVMVLLAAVLPTGAFAQVADSTTFIDSTMVADSTNTVDSTAAVQPDEETASEENHTSFDLGVSLGLTLNDHSAEDDEAFAATWLSGVDARLYSERNADQIEITSRARYGQVHSADAPPEKTEDDLILSITPSIDLPLTGLRLFLENTAETQMRPGEVDGIATGFLDPIVLYEALFVGKRYAHEADDGSSKFDMTAGVGYALQQTVADQFVLDQNREVVIAEHNPLGDVQSGITLESGYCAILSFNLKKKLGESASLRSSLKAVALTKDDAEVRIENARSTVILSFGIQYSVLSLDYSGHLIYDRNISIKRQLDQSLVFGLRFDL